MARIIINGDDLGMNRGCTLAIARAFEEGLITDTTMMANGSYFDEAVRLAKRQGFHERIGIHFNLTEGTPLTKGILAIADFVRDGRFHKGFSATPRSLSEEEREAVYRELYAQARRLTDAGLRITHADSHHYIHHLIPLAPITAAVCRRFGIDRMRRNRTFDTPEHPILTENRVDHGYWQENGFITPMYFGRRADFVNMPIPDGTEVIVHPDFDQKGRLIDRTGMQEGYPTGEPLDFISGRKDVSLICYDELD